MTLDHDVHLLQNIPLFADFPSEQLRLVAFSAEPLSLPEGTTLFSEGAAADCGYVVIAGAVQLTAERGGEEQELAVAGPGALIGELALLAPTTRPVSARTVEPTELMIVSRRLLRRVLEEYPDMAERLRQSLSARLQVMNRELGMTRERLLAAGEIETGRGD